MTGPADLSVEFIPNLLIPMRDGVRLAGNLYRPPGAGRHPCVVNNTPNHKDGRGGRAHAEAVHRRFVRRGYAVLVVDFRGLGCSEGVNNVPFDSQEGRDGHDLVEWAAAQPWCDGAVGMWGVSYGGITALKAAAERPPHLRAIVPVHATADVHADFLTPGGCRGGFWANGDWGPRMVGYNLTPPLADDPDGRLARLWAERLERAEPWALEWYRHGDDAARWAGRAVPVERIAAATYAVCGWHDFYVDGTAAYFNRIPAPKKLLLGPWKHVLPDLSPVEPVNFVELMVRWWDRWLRGADNGADTGPPVALFRQEHDGTGTWQHEEAWPPHRNHAHTLSLLPRGRLDTGEIWELTEVARYAADPTVGLDSLGRDPCTTAVADPGHHNADEARSLHFTTRPLGQAWELTGQARVVLSVTTSAPGLSFTARLSDVSPEDRSRLVTMGWGRDGQGAAGEQHQVEVPLRATSYLFRQGHRIRLSLALADFPRLWPRPGPAHVTVHQSAASPSSLLLPRTPEPDPALPPPGFPPPGEKLSSEAELESTQEWTVSRELVGRSATLGCRTASRYRLAAGGTIALRHDYTATVAERAAAAMRSSSDIHVDRPGGAVRVRTANVFTADAVTIEAEIEQAGRVIYRKKWEHRPPGETRA